jgi:hypothetical protein
MNKVTKWNQEELLKRAKLLKRIEPLAKAFERRQELEDEAYNYRGAETIRLQAGQTLREYLARHPEIPQLTCWTLKD